MNHSQNPTKVQLPDGPFTSAQLPGLSINDHLLRSLLASRRVRRVLRGVYVRSDLPDTVDLRARAVALVVARHHVVVDRTAAWLHGIDTFSNAEHEVLPPIETCALRGREPTRRRDVRGGTRDLLPRDITSLQGVLVTTPLRTALDLACHLRRREAYAVLNQFAREHGVSPEAMAIELGRYRRRRGVIQARQLVPHVDPRVESARESWTLLAIADAGLPLPEPQVWIEIDGVPTYRLDFAYRRHRICVEYDGVEAHERTPEQREHDRKRRAWLRENGWTVIVVRLGDFTGERLGAWLARLREALATGYTTRRW